METKLIWKDAKTAGNGNSEELGKAYTVFADCKYFFVPTKEDKKAVVMFKNSADQVVTVIMQNAVSEAYKDKKLTQAQALTLPVIRMEKLTDKDGNVISDEPSFWLGRPNMGWQEMKKELEKEEISDWETIAV